MNLTPKEIVCQLDRYIIGQTDATEEKIMRAAAGMGNEM
jgi:ATP-dependent protease HslVU (ClpYQ) ATPase subunit